MKPHISSNARDFDASARKTFRSALQQLLSREFPGVFGPTISQLFAQQIQELFHGFHPESTHVAPGQVIWHAVEINDLPARSKRIEQTQLVPVTLDILTVDDIDDIIDGKTWAQLRRKRIVRLCHQTHQQGGVLSHADLALLLGINLTTIGKEIQAHEKETSQLLPRRGTIHDLGTTLTHKAIICYKRFVEKKSTSQVAQETFHSPEAVERYVQALRRVKLCHEKDMTIEEIRHATGHSKALVRQYLNLIEELDLPAHLDENEVMKEPTCS